MKHREHKYLPNGRPELATCMVCSGAGYFAGVFGRMACNACGGTGYELADMPDAEKLLVMAAELRAIKTQANALTTQTKRLSELLAAVSTALKQERNQERIALAAFEAAVAAGDLLLPASTATPEALAESLANYAKQNNIACEIGETVNHWLLRYAGQPNTKTTHVNGLRDTYGT